MALDPIAELEKNGPRPLYLIDGVQTFVDELVQAIRAAVFPPGAMGIDFNLEVLYGRETSWDRILDSAMTLPAFAPRRLIIVHQADALMTSRKKGEDGGLERFLGYLDAPSPTTTLVLAASKLDGKLAPVKRAKAKKVLVSLAAPKERDMPGFVAQRARRLGVDIEPAAVRALVTAFSNDVSGVISALEQLDLYVGPGSGQPIRVADVEAVVSTVREESIFELVDAISSGDARGTTAGLHRLLVVQREAPLKLLALVARQFRLLVKASAALAEGQERGLASLLGVPPFVVNKLSAQARKGDPARFARGLVSISACDRALKGASVDDLHTFERLVSALRRDVPFEP